MATTRRKAKKTAAKKTAAKKKTPAPPEPRPPTGMRAASPEEVAARLLRAQAKIQAQKGQNNLLLDSLAELETDKAQLQAEVAWLKQRVAELEGKHNQGD